MFTPLTLNFFKAHLEQLDSNYLEIGVYFGESIKELAETYPNKKIIAIDPFIEDGCTTPHSGVQRGGDLISQREMTMNGIKDLKNISFYEMTSKKFKELLTPSLIEELNVGAVYIDGSHWYEDVVIDYNLALELIGNKKGMICFDDLDSGHPDVVRACNEFISICGDRIVKTIDITHSNRVFILKNV